MEYLALHAGAPTVNWEDITSYISVLKDKIVAPRVKNFYIPVCFLQK